MIKIQLSWGDALRISIVALSCLIAGVALSVAIYFMWRVPLDQAEQKAAYERGYVEGQVTADMGRGEYYRGAYDICLTFFKDATADGCNDLIVKMAEMQWHENSSDGYVTP